MTETADLYDTHRILVSPANYFNFPPYIDDLRR